MVIKDMKRSSAQLYISLLSDLKPDWKAKIIDEDYNLYKLGFSDDIPCSLSLDVSLEQINELYEEIIDMEIDVYMYENLLCKKLRYMTEVERNIYKQAKENEKRYNKFAPLEGLCITVLHL